MLSGPGEDGLMTAMYIVFCYSYSGVITVLSNKFHRNFSQKSNFSFKKMRLKMSSAKWRPFCPDEDGFLTAM